VSADRRKRRVPATGGILEKQDTEKKRGGGYKRERIMEDRDARIEGKRGSRGVKREKKIVWTGGLVWFRRSAGGGVVPERYREFEQRPKSFHRGGER